MPVFPSFSIVVINPVCLVRCFFFFFSAPADIVPSKRATKNPSPKSKCSEFPWGHCKVNSNSMYLTPPWTMYSSLSRLLCHCCILSVFFGSCCCLWCTLLTCSIASLNPCHLPHLPQVLYQQFKFFLNLYFLVVACSQFVPSLKIGYLYTYWAPLVNTLQFLFFDCHILVSWSMSALYNAIHFVRMSFRVRYLNIIYTILKISWLIK